MTTMHSMATAEEPVCEITLKALLDLLDRFPKKKPVFKAFCHEYGIADIDELTEPLALEIMEIIDGRTFLLVRRQKEVAYLEKKQNQLRESIDHYLERQKDKFVIIDKVDDCWLLAKKISLIVYNKIDNAVFQPYETNTTNEYFSVFALKAAEEFVASEIIGKFVSRGCRIVHVLSTAEMERKLEAIK